MTCASSHAGARGGASVRKWRSAGDSSAMIPVGTRQYRFMAGGWPQSYADLGSSSATHWLCDSAV